MLYSFSKQWEALFGQGSAAGGLATISLAVVLGLMLGAVRVRGVRLGISGVLFTALLFGQLGFTVEEHILGFLRDFALIIFMYAIGLQVGPSFIASLRAEGMRLNALSLSAIVLGAILTAGVVFWSHTPRESASVIYAGAFTTTPGLAAGQEAIRRTRRDGEVESTRRAVNLTGLAYAVSYPFGVVGPILVIVALRRFLKINVETERFLLAEADRIRRPPITTLDIEITRSEQAGIQLRDHPMLRHRGVILSRLLRNHELSVPHADTVLQVGDIFRAVGPMPALELFASQVGRKTTSSELESNVQLQRLDILVTRTKVLRHRLRDLDLIRRAGVTIARVNRAGIDLTPNASLALQFGDRVTAVGTTSGLKIVEDELGNCPDTLNRPQLVPIFLGIVAGVVVGSIPLRLPGLNATMQIGLAGGPMLAAIALSQLGNIGSMVWYMPVAANQLFRDFGLAVFLACVGLQCGDHFLQKLATPEGLAFVCWGAVITLLPVFLVGCVARLVYRVNFVTLSGWVAGAMTSSPALAFAGELTGSEAPSIAYAAVAPLGLLGPVICSQLLVILLMPK